jgi:hypothetical protein
LILNSLVKGRIFRIFIDYITMPIKFALLAFFVRNFLKMLVK